ncbi:MAG: HAMP domain-containing histidine kinase [Robiginitomaculum sp.]|nr:HAMP domain-containing histidine kinase [Robiginitomaculum sp.]
MTPAFSKMSLRKRMVTASVLWVTLGAVIGYWLLSSAFHTHVFKQFYDELDQHIVELENITQLDENGDFILVSAFSDTKYDTPDSGYYWEVRGQNASLKSPSLSGKPIALADEGFDHDIAAHRHKIKGVDDVLLVVEKTTNFHSKNGEYRRFILAVERRHLAEMISEFNTTLAWSFVVLSLSMMFAAALLTSFALHPFKRLSEGFKNVRSGKTEKLDGTYPTEVTPLVGELNAHIASTSDMLKRARAQAGNLAHGLKGSLAIVADEGYKLEEEGLVRSSQAIIQQCNIMQRHIDHHIARARASAAAQLPSTFSNIEDVLPPVITAMKLLHSDKDIDINVQVHTQKPIHMDKIDLNEILGNILDNAYKAAVSRIDIVCSKADGNHILIRLDDDGPGLPTKAYDVVFDLGMRWDETTPGGGLGLAIVRELVNLYGGTCKLGKSPLNGLRVDIILPFIDF